MRKKLGKMFFDGASKVFEGPNNAGNLKRATKVATIGGVKAKAKLSQATKKFKAKVEGIKEGIQTAKKNFSELFPTKNLKLIDGDKKISKAVELKHKSKAIKEYLREPKMGGGMMGRPMYKNGKLVGGQKKLDKDGDGKISGNDFKILKQKKGDK